MKLTHNKPAYIYWGFLLLFAVLAMVMNYVQSMRGTPLIDYAYQADVAYRIFQGEIPYRDFFLVVNPGTYYLMAMLMHLTGEYNHYVQLGGTMVISALIIIISFLVMRQVSRSQRFTLLMLLPLLFAGHSIYPFPNYDINTFLIVISAFLACLHYDADQRHPFLWGFFAGLLVGASYLFKQNIGLIFIPVWTLCVLFICFFDKSRRWFIFFGAALTSIALIFSVFFIWLNQANALQDFIYQTFTFPKQIRDPVAAIFVMKDEYISFFKYGINELRVVFILGILLAVGYASLRFIPLTLEKNRKIQQMVKKILEIALVVWLGWLSFTLYQQLSQVPDREVMVNTGIWFFMIAISAILFIWNGVLDFRAHKIGFITLLPIICIALIFASSLSQGLRGSTYGMWPVYFIMMAWVIRWLTGQKIDFAWRWVAVFLCVFITLFLAWKVQTQSRIISYTDLNGTVADSSLTGMEGLTTPGLWLPEFDQLVEYINTSIPATDTIAFLPGEDLVFEATERQNPLFCNQVFEQTCDKDIHGILKEIEEKEVDWLILKNQYQLRYWKTNPPITEGELPKSFVKIKDIGFYTVYKINR